MAPWLTEAHGRGATQFWDRLAKYKSFLLSNWAMLISVTQGVKRGLWEMLQRGEERGFEPPQAVKRLISMASPLKPIAGSMAECSESAGPEEMGEGHTIGT